MSAGHTSWNDVLHATALEQAEWVRSRRVSSEELVRLALERAERLTPTLHPFVELFPRRALATARQKDAAVKRGEPLPMFHGLPTGIKDLNLVRWTRARLGSAGTLLPLSPFDDRTTSAVRRAGFVLIGKTTTSEVGAMPVTEPDIHPPTRNPWNPDSSAGGSSGGAAAAVAARIVPIAQGSDGGGSIRLPAAFCHLFGFKPSQGRVPNAFGRDDRELIYTCGPIAQDVADAAAFLDVLAGLDIGRPHWAPPPDRSFRATFSLPPPRLRVRFTTKALLGETQPELAEAVVRAARLLSAAGHEVEEGALPDTSFDEFLPVWQQMVASVPLVNWGRAQPITRWLVEGARRFTPGAVRALRRRLAARYLACFDDADVWLTPTSPVPAPRVGAFAGRPPEEAFRDAARLGSFTAIFNVTGQPAASVPLGLTREGLPIGLQVAGRPFADDVVLRVAHFFEGALPWKARRPALAG
jgi:amidase